MARRVEEYMDWGSPWASQSNRFPEDNELREHGFQVHERPQNGPAKWQRYHKIYTQEEALKLGRGT